MSIWVIGFASRAGGQMGNMSLGQARAATVVRRISFQPGDTRNVGTISLGESGSTFGSENSEYRRAVLILVYRRAPYREPPRPRREQPLPFFNTFQISLLGGLEGGPWLAGADYHFWIDYDTCHEDAPPSARCEYSLTALGGGIGLPFATQGGVRWNYFDAGRHCTAEDFSGTVPLGGYGLTVHEFSIANNSFAVFPSDGEPVEFETFETEMGLSAGYSRIHGAFVISGF